MKFPSLSVCFLVICIPFLSAATGNPHTQIPAFLGKPEKGKPCLFSYRSLDNIQYAMKLQGARTPPGRSETQEITLSGTLTILESPDDNTKNGKTILLFRISAFLLIQNGIPADTASLNGRDLQLTFSASGCRTELLESSADTLFPLLSANTGNEGKQPLTPEWKNILESILSGFHGPPPGAVLNPGPIRENRNSWPADSAWLRDILKQRGIESTPAHWSGKTTILGISDFQEIPVLQVSYLLSSAGIPGYDCKIEALYRFPLSAEAGGKPLPPLSISRKITEVVERLLPEDNPVFSGTKFRVIRNNSAEIVLLPAEDPVPAAKH